MNIDWTKIIWEPLVNFWHGFLDFIPLLFVSIIIFIIGWFIASAVGKLVAVFLKRLKFDQVFEKAISRETMKKADIEIDASRFIGAIFKWILVIVFLHMAVGILEWVAFSRLLGEIIGFLPNVIIAALIFVIAIIVADILEKMIRVGAVSAKVGYDVLIGSIVKWSIWIFAIIAILVQLGIAQELLLTLFTGLVALIVIVLGIAFGLGGKEFAAEILQGLRKELKK